MASVEKSDFLKECMSDVGQGPLDLFQKAFCSVCANRNCIRSSANGMAFDRRMVTWKKDLFDNVPRADDADPRFANIRSKRFISADGIPPTVNSNPQPVFLDPSAVKTQTPIEQEMHEPEIMPIAVWPTDDPPAPMVLELPPSPEPKPMLPQMNPAQSNTPFSQGAVLQGFQKEEVSDTVIEAGGSFTFGDSNE